MPDLIVSETMCVSDEVWNSNLRETVRDELRREVENVLPDGYGEQYGEYAQYVTGYNPKARLWKITYEVYL